MAIRPLGNAFLFVFLNETSGEHGTFRPKNSGKIILAGTNLEGQADTPRWGKVLAVGPKVTEFGNGDIVLIEPLQWTQGFKHEDIRIWKSDEAKVMAVADDEESVKYTF
jgi:hypothetical protein